MLDLTEVLFLHVLLPAVDMLMLLLLLCCVQMV
jgi:hypothetical protein